MSEQRLYGCLFTFTVPDGMTEAEVQQVLVASVESTGVALSEKGFDLIQTQIRLIPRQGKEKGIDGAD